MIVYMFVNNLDFLKFCFIYEEILNLLLDPQLNLTFVWPTKTSPDLTWPQLPYRD